MTTAKTNELLALFQRNNGTHANLKLVGATKTAEGAAPNRCGA